MEPRTCETYVLFSLLGCVWSLVLTSHLTAQEVFEVPVIAYSDGASPSQHWFVGAPVLRIGGRSEGPEDTFHDIAHVALLGDGLLVVADGGSSELRFFDSTTGMHVRTVGGAGRGPGEIDGVWDLWVVDSLIVAADVAGTTSFFTIEGSFLFRQPPMISALGRRLELIDFLPGGSAWAFSADSDVQPPGSRVTREMRLAIVKEGTAEFVTKYPWYISHRRGNGRPLPLALGPVAVAAAAGDHICFGFPLTYALDCYSGSGEPLYRIVRADWKQQEVTPGERDTYFRANEAANEGVPGYGARLRESTVFSEQHPAFGLMLGSASGDLWVGPSVPEGDIPVRFPSPDDPTVWSVYSSRGEWLSDVTLPARFRPMAVTHDYLAGVARGDLDVETVVLLPILRR